MSQPSGLAPAHGLERLDVEPLGDRAEVADHRALAGEALGEALGEEFDVGGVAD